LRGGVTLRRTVGVALAGLGLLVGCRQKPAVPKPRDSARQGPIPAANTLDPATLGDVSGVVRLSGAAPAAMRVDTSKDPACAKEPALVEQIAMHDGKLANVYVYVKSGPAAALTHGASWVDPVVIAQRSCNFVPHVAAVMVGQRVEFRNDDSTILNLHVSPAVLGNQAFDISEHPKGAPQVKVFKRPEVMMPVRSVNRPWMSAFLNVSQTPWFAVTAADGTFGLHGLPAGEYTLGFVQEKLGEQTVKVTVRPQATVAADATFNINPGS
jgi:hypothetical protein